MSVARLVLNVGWLPLVLQNVTKLPYWPVLAGKAAGSLVMITATAFLAVALVQAFERTRFGNVRS